MKEGLAPFLRAALTGPVNLWTLPLFLSAPFAPNPGAAAAGVGLLWASPLAHEVGHIVAARRRGKAVVLGADRVGPRVRVLEGSSPEIATAGVKAALSFTIPGALLALPWVHPLLAVAAGVLFGVPGGLGDLKQARMMRNQAVST